MDRADSCREGRRGDESVEPIHEATVPRYEIARILYPEAPFKRRFEQVAALLNNRRRQPQRQLRDDGTRRETAR